MLLHHYRHGDWLHPEFLSILSEGKPPMQDAVTPGSCGPSTLTAMGGGSVEESC